MSKRLVTIGIGAAMLVTALVVPVAAQDQATSDKRVGFSNNYAGNSWRQAMLKSWDASPSRSSPTASSPRRTSSPPRQNDATPAAQISDMILQGYDAIVINAASPERSTAPSSRPATRASWSSRSTASSPADCAYRVVVDFKDMGYQEVEQMADKLPEGGNLLEIRGLAGTSIDEQIQRGHPQGRRRAPAVQDRRLGATATGTRRWPRRPSPTVLPSLPEDIVGVVDQGGDGYGAAQAFAAAGRPRPTIIMGNRQDELAWWKEQKDKDGYETRSASIAPGVSTARLLGRPAGARRRKDIPHDLSCRTSPSTRTTSRRRCADAAGDVGTKAYTLDEIHAGTRRSSGDRTADHEARTIDRRRSTIRSLAALPSSSAPHDDRSDRPERDER